MRHPAIDGLAQEVTDRAGRLDSPQEAAAVLESMGYTDEAARELRRANVFHLSREIYSRQYRHGAARDSVNAVEESLRAERLRRSLPEPVGRLLLRAVLRGLAVMMPAVLLGVALGHGAALIVPAAGILVALCGLQLAALRLTQLLDSLPHRCSLAETHVLAERARTWYWQAVRSVIAASAAGSATVFSATALGGRHAKLLGAPPTLGVVALATSISILVLWSLLNAILAVGLSRGPVPAAVVSGTGANVAAGLVLSRALVSSAAVLALAAGATVLCILSTRPTLRMLEEADYRLYAAF